MAIIVFNCPFCDTKVETPEENVGREGQCPGCQKISRIPDPRAAQAARAPARPGARFRVCLAISGRGF